MSNEKVDDKKEQKEHKDPKDFMKKQDKKDNKKKETDELAAAIEEAVKSQETKEENKESQKNNDETKHEKKHGFFGKHYDNKEDEKNKQDEKDIKIAELTDLVKRTQAEFINYKNRTEKENKQMFEYSSFDFVKKMLPVLDSFELALKNAPESGFKKGVEMVYAQLLDVLKQEGVRSIDCVGKKFDPYYHEVMLKEKSDKAEDTVLEEFQKGFMMKERVLRYSKVKVSG